MTSRSPLGFLRCCSPSELDFSLVLCMCVVRIHRACVRSFRALLTFCDGVLVFGATREPVGQPSRHFLFDVSSAFDDLASLRRELGCWAVVQYAVVGAVFPPSRDMLFRGCVQLQIPARTSTLHRRFPEFELPPVADGDPVDAFRESIMRGGRFFEDGVLREFRRGRPVSQS